MILLHSFCRASFFVCGFSFLQFLKFKYIIKSFKNKGIFALFASFISYSYLILFPMAFNTILDCPGKTGISCLPDYGERWSIFHREVKY